MWRNIFAKVQVVWLGSYKDLTEVTISSAFAVIAVLRCIEAHVLFERMGSRSWQGNDNGVFIFFWILIENQIYT